MICPCSRRLLDISEQRPSHRRTVLHDVVRRITARPPSLCFPVPQVQRNQSGQRQGVPQHPRPLHASYSFPSFTAPYSTSPVSSLGSSFLAATRPRQRVGMLSRAISLSVESVSALLHPPREPNRSPVMRLGKPVEHLQAALRAAQSSTELGEQLATIGRQLAYFGYLTYDAIVWVSFLHIPVSTRALHLSGKCSQSRQPQAFHHSESGFHLKPVLAVRNFTQHYTWSAQGQ